MPQQKPLLDYADEYWHTVELAYRREQIIIKCSDEKQAGILRRHLYNFRSALRDEDPECFCRAMAEQLTFSIHASSLLITREQPDETITDLLKETLNAYTTDPTRT